MRLSSLPTQHPMPIRFKLTNQWHKVKRKAMVSFASLVLVSIITVTIWYLWEKRASASTKSQQVASTFGKNVLMVFAHPDDESMFFAPFLRAAEKEGVRVHMLCLSNGNFAGLGKLREKELVDAAAYFNIPPSCVKVIADDPNLQDGMKEKWPAETIRNQIVTYMEEVLAQGEEGFDSIVTFDIDGVSSHPNHISTFVGCTVIAKENRQNKLWSVQHNQSLVMEKGVFTLRTRPLWAKYCGVLSVLHPLFAGVLSGASGADVASPATTTILIPPAEILCSLRAMQRHSSQLVWFRYLFVWFSSYTFLNEFSNCHA